MKDLLSLNKTKEALIIYLCEKFLKNNLFHKNNLIVAWGNACYCANDGYIEELASTQEEVDTKIIFHSIYTSKKHSSKDSLSLNVFSPDTDVLVLLIKYYNVIISDTFFITGSGIRKRKLNINILSGNLNKLQREALPAFHAISGCDSTGGFSKKGK